jgi:serine/threonine protein kinase
MTTGVNKDMVSQLKKEIQVMRLLKSPWIVKFYGSEIVSTDFCIYMEQMNSGSLLKVREDLPEEPSEETLKFYAA